MFSSGTQHYFDFTRPETVNLDRMWTNQTVLLGGLIIGIQSFRMS